MSVQSFIGFGVVEVSLISYLILPFYSLGRIIFPHAIEADQLQSASLRIELHTHELPHRQRRRRSGARFNTLKTSLKSSYWKSNSQFGKKIFVFKNCIELPPRRTATISSARPATMSASLASSSTSSRSQPPRRRMAWGAASTSARKPFARETTGCQKETSGPEYLLRYRNTILNNSIYI